MVQTAGLLHPGRNCWVALPAERAVALTNADYFRALAAALVRATRLVMLLGWDLDPNLRLDPDAPGPRGEPLHRFLEILLRANADLRIRFLLWKRTMFYGGNGRTPRLLAALRARRTVAASPT